MENKNRVVSGPFGKYEHDSVGAVLNSLCTVYEVPLSKVEQLRISFDKNHLGVLTYNNKPVGIFKWFEGIDHAVVGLINEWYCYASQNNWVDIGDNELKPNFKLTLSAHELPMFEISGEYATETLHNFIRYPMLTNYMRDPCYKLMKDSGAFFQGGSNDPKGKWIMIEFWKPKGAQAWMDYLNNNYVHHQL